MRKLRAFSLLHWRLLTALTAAVLVVAFLLLFKLGSLSGGLSDQEISQQAFSGSWHHIVHNPLGAPLTAVQWLLLTISSHHGQTITRLPSVGFGLLTLGAFAYVLRRWYGTRTAILGTVVFALSSWFLHVSRLGTSDVLYLWALPTLLALQIFWQRHSNRPLVSLLAIIGVAILLYIPGMLWLIILGIVLQARQLTAIWKNMGQWWLRSGAILLFLLALMPLGYAVWQTPNLLQTWLGLPAHFGPTTDIVKRLGDSVSFFIFRGPLLPQLWLDRLPLLDLFSLVMALAGGIFYARHLLLPRSRLLIGLFIVSAVFFALKGPVAFSLLVPLVYFVVAAGIGYVLHEWLRVFPRNPLARSVGFGLLGVAILLACTYNFRAYFIAWPHNSATHAVFHNRR